VVYDRPRWTEFVNLRKSWPTRVTTLVFLGALTGCQGLVTLSEQCDPSESGCWARLGSAQLNASSIAESADGLLATAGTSKDLLVQPGSRSVFRFGDLEQEWIEVHSGPWAAFALVAAHDSSGNRRFIAGATAINAGRPIHVSETAGETWKAVDTPGWVFALAVDPHDSTAVIRGGIGDIHVSTDGGDSWELVFGSQDRAGLGVRRIEYSGPSSDVVWASFVNPFNRPFLLRSADRGLSWTTVRDSILDRLSSISDIVVDPDDVSHVWIAVGNSMIESRDGGESWTLHGEIEGLAKEFVVLDGVVYLAGSRGRNDPDGDARLMLLKYDAADNAWTQVPVPVLPGATTIARGLNSSLLIGTLSGVFRFRP